MLRLEIRGRVQGVGYRWAMAKEARRLGINGWVRNRYDGSVEAVVSGSAALLEQIVSWARRGPAAAEVVSVDVVAGEGNGEGKFESFDQLPTC